VTHWHLVTHWPPLSFALVPPLLVMLMAAVPQLSLIIVIVVVVPSFADSLKALVLAFLLTLLASALPLNLIARPFLLTF
jgi:hypothetical protein